jgi:DNA mismatch endonuclease, patch repair protein
VNSLDLAEDGVRIAAVDDTVRTVAGGSDRSPPTLIREAVEREASSPGSVPTSPATSSRMSRQASRDTAPEVALRKELHRRGLRFRVDHPVPGLPRRRTDIIFTRQRIAVFVDGCFWHSCPLHGTAPISNREWWAAKLRANVRRDRETDAFLLCAGWTVLRFWEHDAIDVAAASVEREVRRPVHGCVSGCIDQVEEPRPKALR